MTNEVRTTDADTGAQKGVKLERFDLVPVPPLTELARHYGMGGVKYADRNWEKGYDWGKSYQAALRHLTQFWGGEDLDPDPFYDQFPEEVRPKHVIAAAWHCFALAQFMDQHPEKDNRAKLLVPAAGGGWTEHDAIMGDLVEAAQDEAADDWLRVKLQRFANWLTTVDFDPELGKLSGQERARVVVERFESVMGL